MIAGAIWLVAIALLILAFRKARIGRGGLNVGAAGAGAVYDMLNEDKRKAVEIVVEAQRPDLRHAHEALPVERHAPPSRERGDRLQWELAACERGDVHPAPRRQLRDVGRLPHVAERVDRHGPDVAVVGERERVGRLAVHVADGCPELRERRQQRGAVCVGAACEYPRGHAQSL